MMIRNKKHHTLLKFENLCKYDSLFHFSTTIQGGVSSGNYASLNLGIYAGDDINCVNENRTKLASMIGVEYKDLFFPYQTHEDKILIIDNHFLTETESKQHQLLNGIDAIVTNQKNICIGVSTADCVPILIYDPILNVLAAIHAGWRGTVAKIAIKTIEKMREVFGCNPSDLIAGIAPCISQKHFEVGEEVVESFISVNFDMDKIAYRNPDFNKMHISLSLANKILSEEAGILPQNIELSGLCTFSSSDLFFSARRQTINSGRMITGGVLK